MLYANARKANFLRRIKRSYRIDYDQEIKPNSGSGPKSAGKTLISAKKLETWLIKNNMEISPGFFIMLIAIILSFIFIPCLFMRAGLFIFVAISVIVIFLFYIFIDLKGRKINMKKEAQMEAFLIDLGGCLYGNPNVLAGIKKAAESSEDPLKKEFETVILDTRKGLRLNEALARLVQRNRSKIIQVIITGLIAANEKGVNLADFLKDQVDYLREKKSIENYIRILSSGPRYTSYIIALIPFVALIAASLINKNFAPALISGVGLYVLIYACASYLAGFVIINRIVNFSDMTDRSIN